MSHYLITGAKFPGIGFLIRESSSCEVNRSYIPGRILSGFIKNMFNPDYALEILLRLEIAAISSVSSIFFLEMGVTIPSS